MSGIQSGMSMNVPFVRTAVGMPRAVKPRGWWLTCQFIRNDWPGWSGSFST